MNAPMNQSAADYVRELMRSVKIPSLASLGHSRDECINLAESLMSDVFITRSPLQIDMDVMTEMLSSVYDNYR